MHRKLLHKPKKPAPGEKVEEVVRKGLTTKKNKHLHTKSKKKVWITLKATKSSINKFLFEVFEF